MGGLPSWEDMVNGNCPFCAPREDINEFSFKVADFSISTLYLDREQIYAGYCALIFNKRHVTGIENLDAEELSLYTQDLKRAAEALVKVFAPDHMNYASLGNAIPHLHTHIIPRYKNDPSWGMNPWKKMDTIADVRFDNDAAYIALADKIRESLGVTT